MVDQQARAAGVGLRSERGPVLGALMLATGLVAIDATIIATAVPSVVRDLGGFTQFPWLFSVYLLTQAVTVPIYGRLADVYGRRPLLSFGIGVFLVASVLCGLAWSMPALIAFRALQGVGAGAVQPISMTVIGDLYSVAERARVQGYIASVWGLSSVVGPTLGGVFSEYLSWRWIFFVNLPIGALAATMLARRFHERVEPRSHRIDYLGAALLTSGCSLVILGLLEGGVAWAWGSPTSLAVLGGGALLLAVVVVVERRAVEPVLPLWVFRHRTLVGGNLAAVAVGAVLMGLTSYVPTYVQGVLGTDALVAGFTLAAMTVGWPLAVMFVGRIYLRVGFRDTALGGSLVVVAGTLLCSLLGADSRVWQVAAACFVVGVGLGVTSSPTVVAVQSVVDWGRRGVVTGTHMFARSIGSAVGVAVFGAIANAGLGPGFDARSLLGDGAAHLTAASRQQLAEATHDVFLALVAAALVGVLALLVMPRRTERIELVEPAGPGDQPG